MANVTVLAFPRDILFSSDTDRVIAFLVTTVKTPDDRIPAFLQWAYVNGHNTTSEELELLMQLTRADVSPSS